ncbi:MAG: InlB B-repeat-containing protein [Rudaea sp.]
MIFSYRTGFGAFALACVLGISLSASVLARDEDTPPVMSAQAYAEAAGLPAVLTVTKEDHHDVLPSLRNAVLPPGGYGKRTNFEGLIPLPPGSTDQVDGAVQSTTSPTLNTPGAIHNMDGVGNGFTGPQGTFFIQYAPPDTEGAVGWTQFVSLVNTGLAVFDKTTGNVVYGPVPTSTLWSGFGGGCESNNDGDAVVIYDRAANRWVVSQFSVNSLPYLQCVAVSQTSDATGAWNRYSFNYGNSNFPDYPKMGSWPDAYYETFNVFAPNFIGANVCAYDRTNMLAGNAATQQCFQLSSAYGGVLPSDLDGAKPPPAGSPNYLINYGTKKLNLWKFHVDWTTPANTTLTGPTAITVAAFAPACAGGTCITQPGTTNQLDSLADRMMFRLAYRNFGAHQSLVASHSVQVIKKTNVYSGARWYEIRSPGTTPVVYQQSTFAPDTTFRWMPSIAMDSASDIALGYSASSSTTSVYPSVRYTGRTSSDALSTMETEVTLFAGSGSQSGGLHRWGDYSAMTVDPVDDCTFWYTNEYIASNGSFNWKTRIGSFKFPNCTPAPLAYLLTYTTDGNGTISGTTPQAVAPAGSGTAVTAVPYAGYHFVHWSDGKTTATRTDTNVQGNINVQAQFAVNVLVFTPAPGSVTQGDPLGTVIVTEQDGSNNTIADNAMVDFTLAYCSGATLDLGTATMSSGVATLPTGQRFYNLAGSPQITASIVGTSPIAPVNVSLSVTANSDMIYPDGFDGCRP